MLRAAGYTVLRFTQAFLRHWSGRANQTTMVCLGSAGIFSA